MEKKTRKDRIIVALDTPDKIMCERLVHTLSGTVSIFKIGSELFTACGYEAISIVLDAGAQVFLDLKFYDIPNTVANVSQIVSRFGVKMFNVHALGGEKMMRATKAAVEGETQKRGLTQPLILAVTILTSLSQENMQQILGTERSLDEQVLRLAESAKESGLDGIVASAHEVAMIKKKLGKDFIVVTPGVRPSWVAQQDQIRVVTPKEAFDNGSDYLVIGRPITSAADPLEAAQRIVEEVEQ
ncbi:MAG: orotidine-5'-phosphate decarboxylase [Candidatus Omnitrophica bacterium]|nr:orotidine-5'-phosphate decarboxylase [Candidatus Omnitrophota bacterium]